MKIKLNIGKLNFFDICYQINKFGKFVVINKLTGEVLLGTKIDINYTEVEMSFKNEELIFNFVFKGLVKEISYPITCIDSVRISLIDDMFYIYDNNELLDSFKINFKFNYTKYDYDLHNIYIKFFN